MRSRYSAYVLGLDDYLLASWHASSRPAALDLQDEPPRKWLDLTINQQHTNPDDTGVVEYCARFKIGGRAYRLHETSRFVREQGRWYYRDGDIHD